MCRVQHCRKRPITPLNAPRRPRDGPSWSASPGGARHEDGRIWLAIACRRDLLGRPGARQQERAELQRRPGRAGRAHPASAHRRRRRAGPGDRADPDTGAGARVRGDGIVPAGLNAPRGAFGDRGAGQPLPRSATDIRGPQVSANGRSALVTFTVPGKSSDVTSGVQFSAIAAVFSVKVITRPAYLSSRNSQR